MEARLQRDTEMKKLYTKFMEEYLNNGFMEPVNPPPENSQHFFLPHHGVLKTDSTTTKLRVVFNAGMKTSNGVSLNDILLPGPALQSDITDILIKFRSYAVVFSGDIKQMYLQIPLHPSDHKYQLIFWRAEPWLPLQVYALTTVTFGINSSPFLAIRTIKQLIKDHGHKYPRAAKALSDALFMDDLVHGDQSPEEARSLLMEIIALLSEGGFYMRKWTSNVPSILADRPSADLEMPKGNPENPYFKLLGIIWSSIKDTFSYKIPDFPPAKTKRDIASQIASVFDPCGWLLPVFVKGKVFLQELWLLKVDWDDSLPQDVLDRWHQFTQTLPKLSDISIPRFLDRHKQPTQIHIFTDASEMATSCALYLRFAPSSTENKGQVHLIIAKSKVAPLKKVSLPRLELVAANMGMELLRRHATTLEHYEVNKVFAWTDSSIVLSWIQTPTYRLKTFVANRVTSIHETPSQVIWRHVKSSDNPADCATRGLSPEELSTFRLWWSGPSWLADPEETWPVSNLILPSLKALPDVKSPRQILKVQVGKEEVSVPAPSPQTSIRLPSLSSWTKVVHSLAYVWRFGARHFVSKNLEPIKKGFLSLSEIEHAEFLLLKLIQRDTLSSEIRKVRTGEKLSAKSKAIKKLNPYLDHRGLLRAGGRLEHASLPESSRYPIILSSNHHVVRLLVQHYHIDNLHAPPQLLFSLIVQRFWILGLRNLIKSIVDGCVVCFRANPKNQFPQMAPLPSFRVQPSPPFYKTGLDYCGFFNVKVHFSRFARVMPVYVCVFVCMSTKAVHLESVCDLSTNAFIGALHRFVARRGLAAHIYCDQASNFKGAVNLFQRLLSPSNSELIQFSHKEKIEFHLNVPTGPHLGGIWEAVVKSFKFHLKRTYGLNVLTQEEFNTLIARIEAVLNSRPLTALSSDHRDLLALTPGHFLIGRPLVALPNKQYDPDDPPILRRWHLAELLAQQFWRRWHIEYLHTLLPRGKWWEKEESLKEGQLVVLHDPSTPPLRWKLGRVIELHPGRDGQTRVVDVRTACGTLRRPVVKLFPLPVAENLTN